MWVGETSDATDGITEINLANSIVGSDPSSWNGAFFLRNTGGGNAGLALDKGTQTGITWNQITPSFNGAWNAGEGDRTNIVRYVSPTWNGFVYSSSWGEDDMWDAALRYAGEHHGFRVAAGIGYRQINDNPGKSGADSPQCADLSNSLNESSIDCNLIGLSASVMHVATGLYVTGSWGRIEDENRQRLFNNFGNETNVDNEDDHWYVQAGIEQKWIPFGKSTFYGEYGWYDTGAGLNATGGINTNFFLVSGDADFDQLRGSRVEMWSGLCPERRSCRHGLLHRVPALRKRPVAIEQPRGCSEDRHEGLRRGQSRRDHPLLISAFARRQSRPSGRLFCAWRHRIIVVQRGNRHGDCCRWITCRSGHIRVRKGHTSVVLVDLSCGRVEALASVMAWERCAYPRVERHDEGSHPCHWFAGDLNRSSARLGISGAARRWQRKRAVHNGASDAGPDAGAALAGDETGAKSPAGTEVRIPGLGKLGVIPKVDFGLELLYGAADPKRPTSEPPAGSENAEGVTVRGKLKF